MFVEFRVSNFMSIKEEACLSLVAGRGQEHRETHLVTPVAANEDATYETLVRTTVIYGANAAGKTNLLFGLLVMVSIVTRSHQDPEVLHSITPFKFDPGCKNSATTFEVIFIAGGIRYQYGFAASDEKVLREWLYAWPRGRRQTWLERDGQSFFFGPGLKGAKKVWENATRQNALFLSTAVALNSEQLRPLFHWFDQTLVMANSGFSPTISRAYSQDARKRKVLEFLIAADFAIADIRVEEKEITPEEWGDDAPEELRAWVQRFGPKTHTTDFFGHAPKPGGPVVELTMAEESAGTAKMYCFAGPIDHALQNGQIVVIDEMNKSLHPALVQYLVDLFHDPDRNVSGAQLVFATHDISILNQDTFRRDQVWFCERNPQQETQLYSLLEFRPRKEWEDLERAYLAGRYGAIPYIRTHVRPMDT